MYNLCISCVSNFVVQIGDLCLLLCKLFVVNVFFFFFLNSLKAICSDGFVSFFTCRD